MSTFGAYSPPVPSPSQPVLNSAFRNPTFADDITRGNIVNGVNGWTGASRLWLNLSTGQFFTCNRNTAGNAEWLDAGTPTALPVDAGVAAGASITATCAFYGTKPLLAAWANGNLFKVQRLSDSTTQIIAAINGVTDVATLNTFLSGTAGQVITWYDQSGNGNDATQGTIANAPFIRVLGSECYVVFDQESRTQKLVLPSVTWGSSFSLFEQAQLASCIGGIQYAMFELGTDTSNFQTYFTKTPSTNSWSDQTRVNLSPTYLTTADCNPGPFSFISTSTTGSATAYWGERSVNNINWCTKGTPVGGLIGEAVQPAGGPFYFIGTLQAVMIWGGLAMSGAQALAARKAMYQTFKTVPQCYNDQIITDGDSEMSADAAYYPRISGTVYGGGAYFAMVQALTGNGGAGLLNRPCRWTNTAISGETMTSISSNYATRDVPLMDPNARNRILILNGGEHEGDSLGDTPAQALTVVQSFFTTARATSNPSWSAIFYFNMASYHANVFGGGGETMEQWRLAPTTGGLGFNDLVRQAGLPITALLDIGNDPNMGPLNAYTNTAYFAPDGIHWGGTNGGGAGGYRVAAALIAPAVNAQLGAV